MKDLFYTEADSTLFWIAGYDNANPIEILKDAEKFAEIADCKVEDVRTLVVTKSRSSLHCRVFFITKLLTKDTLPKGTYFCEALTPENKKRRNFGGYLDENIPSLQFTMQKVLEE